MYRRAPRPCGLGHSSRAHLIPTLSLSQISLRPFSRLPHRRPRREPTYPSSPPRRLRQVSKEPSFSFDSAPLRAISRGIDSAAVELRRRFDLIRGAVGEGGGFRSDPGLNFAGGFGGAAGPAAAMDRAELTNEQVSAWGSSPASQTDLFSPNLF